MTKKGVQREDAPSPEDKDGIRAHLKTFEDAIQQLMDKLANLSEELGEDQHIAIEKKISEQLDDAMTKLPSLQSDPESMPVPVEDLISQEQLLDAKFEDNSFDQKEDTPQKSEPIQMVSPNVSVETVPESVCPPSNQSPLPDGVLLTPVKYPQQPCTPPPEQPDMETGPLVEHISFINSPMDTDDNPHPKDKPTYDYPQPPKSLPTI
ncbi:hypothetical protein DSO57_1028309 [Entomophthora muscae]|uniref:Uncharacterized protein n=1 Tax=Entomophthora muscae TaxID=34485 RepID=A0ACC2T1P7_9FUNG|nr:hypothetical protein DSO57_1028309 [Entomophthora muscae]